MCSPARKKGPSNKSYSDSTDPWNESETNSMQGSYEFQAPNPKYKTERTATKHKVQIPSHIILVYLGLRYERLTAYISPSPKHVQHHFRIFLTPELTKDKKDGCKIIMASNDSKIK